MRLFFGLDRYSTAHSSTFRATTGCTTYEEFNKKITQNSKIYYSFKKKLKPNIASNKHVLVLWKCLRSG